MTRCIIATRPRGASKWFWTYIHSDGYRDTVTTAVNRMKARGTVCDHIMKGTEYDSLGRFEEGRPVYRNHNQPQKRIDLTLTARKRGATYIYWIDSKGIRQTTAFPNEPRNLQYCQIPGTDKTQIRQTTKTGRNVRLHTIRPEQREDWGQDIRQELWLAGYTTLSDNITIGANR